MLLLTYPSDDFVTGCLCQVPIVTPTLFLTREPPSPGGGPREFPFRRKTTLRKSLLANYLRRVWSFGASELCPQRRTRIWAWAGARRSCGSLIGYSLPGPPPQKRAPSSRIAISATRHRSSSAPGPHQPTFPLSPRPIPAHIIDCSSHPSSPASSSRLRYDNANAS